MAVTAAQVTVTGTATALNTAGPGLNLLVSAQATGVFVGPSNVTTSTGLELPNGTPVAVDLDPGDVLYAIHATSATVEVLRT